MFKVVGYLKRSGTGWDFIRNSFVLDYDQAVIDEIERQAELADAEKYNKSLSIWKRMIIDEAIEAVIEAGQAVHPKRKLKLGYGRAAFNRYDGRNGRCGILEGSKPRQVIMTRQEWYERKLNR